MKWLAMVSVLIFSCGVLVSPSRPAGGAAPGLKIGVASATITPFLDVPLVGYYYPRMPDGVHDDLHAKALVIDDGHEQAVLVACDLVEVTREAVEEARRQISAKSGTRGPYPDQRHAHAYGPEAVPSYVASLAHSIADSVLSAEGRKQPATLRVAIEQEPVLAHNRRYLMKDGGVMTNPGFRNPNIVRAAGPIDPRVGVLEAEDEQHNPMMTWVNYAMHLDTVGGTWISSDYAYYLARTLAAVKGPDVLTIFTIGPAGDINHWDVSRPGPQRGFETARGLGETLAGDVVKAYTHLEALDSVRIKAVSETIELPLAKITPQDVAEAEKVVAQPPQIGVDFTLDRVKAEKVLHVDKRKGEKLKAEVQVLNVGPVAFVGIPGEYFVELRDEDQEGIALPLHVHRGARQRRPGLHSSRRGFEEGGYEPTSTPMAAGSGEKLADTAIELLKRCKE